jgi:two-component system, LytTR family, response regulator
MKKRYTTIIVDDERLVRLYTRSILEEFDQLHIIDEAENGEEAIEKINRQKPDIIFLDIQMPDINGFEVLKHLLYKPHIVFATAYDEYAVKAFEENSIDYLLKPIEKDRVAKTINKIESLQQSADIDIGFLQNLLLQKKSSKTITVKQGNKIILLKFENIIWLEAKEKYVSIKTSDNKEYLTELTITELTEKVPENYIRIQRSIILNINFIKEIQKHFNNRFIFLMNDRNGTLLQSGTSYVNSIRAILSL